jgi:hypothetical protein
MLALLHYPGAWMVLLIFCLFQGLAWFGAHSGTSDPCLQDRVGCSLATGAPMIGIAFCATDGPTYVVMSGFIASLAVTVFGVWISLTRRTFWHGR